MAPYPGPKHKLSRREGVNLTGTRSASLEKRLRSAPGTRARAGQRPRRVSEYGRQLREKQKLKRRFGMREKQFRLTFDRALRSQEPTGTAFLKLLESRLDNVVYRIGFTPTLPMARQVVNHRHVLVNGKRVDIPSYRVSPGDTITLTGRAAQIPDIQGVLEDPARRMPSWLARDGAQPEGRIISEPNPEEFDIPVDMELIIAFYAR